MLIPRVATLALATSLVAGAAMLPAQVPLTAITLDSGTLVRMHPRVGGVVLGRLTQRFGAASDTLAACRYPGPPCLTAADSTFVRHYPAVKLSSLEVQRGNHLASGAIGGGLLGALLGGLLGLASNALCDSDPCPVEWHFAVGGAAAFGILGGLFGAASPTWRPATATP